MMLQSQQQVDNTRKKLRLLEERLAELKHEPVENIKVREWSIRSLAKLIKQMKEEILRFEAHERSAVKSS